MKKFKQLLALMLSVTMLAGLVPVNVMPVEAMGWNDTQSAQDQNEIQTLAVEDESRAASEVIDAAIFFSDLHAMYNGDSSEGNKGYKKDVVTSMMTALKNTGLTFSSVTSVGDAFSSNEKAYTGKTSVITGYIRAALGDQDIPVNYTWSDHDRAALAENDTDLLENKSGLIYGAGKDGIYGNEDDGNYYVYAISMSDTSSAERYSQPSTFTTQKLQDFKNAVEVLDNSKPIFIASHQPLLARRSDNQYAYQWCTAINEVAESRDVAFFFGHNHNYDKTEDYYYGKGDTMTVQDGSSTKAVKLNFTHLCTGYFDPATTGYAGNSRQGTVMLVTVYDDAINYTTYCSNGVYTGSYALNETVTRDHAVQETINEVRDEETKTTLYAPGVTAVNVIKKIENPNPAIYKAYVKYDINPVDYTDGKNATVSIELDESFSENGNVTVLDVKKQTSSVWPVVNRVVTFTTNHFSEYDVMEINENAMLQATGSLKEKQTVKITQTSELINGTGYVLVSNTGNGTLTKTINGNNRFTLVAGTVTDHVWYYEDGGFYCLDTNGNKQWMTIGNKEVSLLTTRDSTSSVSRVNESSDSTFRLSNADNIYLNKEGAENGGINGGAHGWNQADNNSNWRIYKLIETPVTLSVAPSSMEFYISSEAVTQQLIPIVKVNGIEITDYTLSYSSNNTDIATVTNDGLVTSKNAGETTIIVTLTKANQQDLSSNIVLEVPVKVNSATITGVTISENTGTVAYKSKETVKTGSKLTVSFSEGETKIIDVTVSMLSGDFRLDEAGTYTGLTVTYNGHKIENYTLVVLGPNNYPEYPYEGAVKVNKTATGIDFQSSGVAQVELSASGVPIKKGADVIIMLDTSSSMNSNKVKDENGKETSYTRLQVLQESLNELITQFKTPGDDGELLDIKVAIADFNGYYDEKTGTPYDQDENDYFGSASYDQDSAAKIYTGSGKLDAKAFVHVSDASLTAPTLSYTSGTNYDYAFDAIYQLGTAIKASNGDEERDLYVIFMSDGAAFQWNYYHSRNSQANWGKWITGSYTTLDAVKAAVNCDTHAYYYDLVDHDNDGQLNEHRMANAIKGDPNSQYEIIRKTTDGLPIGTLKAVDETYPNLYKVPGLGATMFTINFDAQTDGSVSETDIDKSLASTASDQTGTTQYYYKVTTAQQLTHAFDVIGTEISYAASDARFIDQLGNDFNLQLKPSTYTTIKLDANGNTFDEDNDNQPDLETKTIAPKIEILTYDIYTKTEADAIPEGTEGDSVTEAMIGQRKGTSTILETVTFSTDGTEAYSDLIFTTNADGTKVYTNILADGTQEGYVKGVIYAKTFVYNTNVTDVAVEGVKIPTGNGTETTNLLPSETFYWKMGTVQTKELAMRYYVYLEGSMEGQKEAGSYPTNEYAILYYDNYLGNACEKPTVSPTMAWKSANVSYAFYLVNDKGEIIVNQTTGQTGSFANKVAVTNPVVYKEILLNNKDQVQSIDVAAISGDVLPKYYTLYDEGAKYAVTINSNSTGSWEITNGGKEVNSTYVTHFTDNASAYSNALQNSTVGNDYTHTIVWFAVVWNVQAHPDTVVIDYGLPVDISVLTNDMFGDNGKLAGVGPYAEKLDEIAGEQSIQSGFGSTYSGTKYGSAAVNADKVRYTPVGMEMNGYDKFAYAVNYTGTENSGYYYDSVTVIPATTIYYEDSFVEYDTLVWGQKEDGQPWEGEWIVVENPTTSIWTQVGTVSDATQQEDRPGQYAITDANNIYGYDSANKSMSTYSLGSAMKATVDYDNSAQASFRFWGTGFDVISMTSNKTGLMLIDVYLLDTDGNRDATVKSLVVDTYYGYKKIQAEDEDGNLAVDENGDPIYEWVVDDNASNSIYQVPVMKVEKLSYGHYEAVIKAVYEPAFDHVEGSSTYDFYLDAIRIYDPVGDGIIETATGNDNTILNAYKADHEGWPSYLELRNGLIDQETLGNSETNTVIEGLVFIDGNSKVGDEKNELSDYENYGPNNEVYIAPGQRVAFMLDTPENIDKVRIGIKSADGKVGTYTITNIAKADSTDGMVTAGDYYNARTFTIDTATDMYYDLTGWKADIIVISNTGDRYSTDGVISITNIKSTYTSDPSNEVTAFPEQEETENETVMYMTPAAAMLTLRSLNTPVEEPTVPEEEVTTPEVEIFVPEKLEVKVHKGKVKTGEKVKVTVTTSSDVEAIEINGSEITNFKATKHGDRKWEVTIIAEEAGTLEITVTAKNADGNSSEAITSFVEVTRKVFKPRKLDVKLQKNKVKAGQKVKVTVTTSSDVEVIEINGNEITNFKAKGMHERTWETTITAEESGKMNVSVVAKDKDGNLSAPVTKIVEVTKKHGK